MILYLFVGDIMKLFDNIFEIDNDNYYGVVGLNKETNYIYIYNKFLNDNKNVLVLTSSLYEASYAYQGILNYTDKVLFFPMDDFITSEAVSISPEFKIERINTINKLLTNDKYIVVTNLMGFLRYLPNKKTWLNSIVHLSVNDKIDRDKLMESFYNLGYEVDNLVSKTGSIASRGYIIDIFPIGEEYPIRIELWGNVIDSIRYFDVDTQLSTKHLKEITVMPTSEFLLDKYDENVIRKQKYLKHYANDIESLSYYMNDYICFYYDYSQIKASYEKIMSDIVDYNTRNTNEFETDYMFHLEEINVKNEIFLMNIDNLSNLELKKYKVSGIVNYNEDIEVLKESVNKYIISGKTVVIAVTNRNIFNKIRDNMDALITNEDNIVSNKINLINKKIGNGFIIGDLVVISEFDLYKVKENNYTYKSKYKLGTKVKDINNIHNGDYIVHEIHGIGQYEGIVTLNKNGYLKDYIKLLYNKGDVLYLPVEKIDRISLYSAKEGHVPKINTLGSGDFIKKKLALKKKFEDIASKLLKIYAMRESQNGYAFSHDDENQLMFESEFMYEETDDQLSAVKKIKEEMERNKPMDMLLCGDVGYGKTEVAFRAMFKAVNDGKQVAYLCPTTILSSQQYNNALIRFKNFPVNIALMNRFVSKGEQNIIIQKLKEGKIDILFGTHRILSNDIVFKDLGLLVIDEEQRFGVKHKEKIKEYKSNIDVLTLSATPIPRTLQMSMAGIRSLALIETPPVDRLPIQTYVLPLNDSVVKDAIYKELARKGQSFILYNKIEDIELEVEKIKSLVPEARVSYAHGQMSKEMLEDRMQDFIDYKSDVMVCTTIIETGIDIPNVNTLIIKDADHFGLSQLYQIRGRIGRSSKIGYAYLMYDNRKELNDIAVKRLQAIKEFTELGSGFKIAMRDLSIRGVGDILGSEQSGFVESVGIDLYMKLLNDEINKLKGIEVIDEDNVEDSKPLIDIDTHISSDYTVNDDIKIEIHKKINEVDSYAKLLKLKDELDDRFGTVTKDMEIYMYEEWFEKLAKKLSIQKVNQTKNYIELILPSEISSKIDGEKLFMDAYKISRMFRFNYKNGNISIILDTVKLENHFLVYLNNLLEVIIKDIEKK